MMAESLIASEIYISMDVFTACSVGHLHTVQKIITSYANEKGALLETQSKKRKWTPLMYAAQGGHFDVVKYLLKQGALVTAKNNRGQIALMIAAKYGHHKCVETLVEGNANIDAIDHQGGTALSYAVRSGHRDIVNFLLEKKCPANAFSGSNVSPLIIAAAAGHEMIVQDLLEHNADIFFCNETGSTATYMAVKSENDKVLDVIENYLMSIKLAAKAVEGNWIEEKDSTSLKKILKASNLSCYDAFFQSNGVNIMTLWHLSIQDLKNIGIFFPGDIQKLIDIICKRRHLYYKEFHLTKLVRTYVRLQHQMIKAENDLMKVKKHKSDINGGIEKFDILWVQYKISNLQGFIMNYELKDKISEVQNIFAMLKSNHADQGPIFSPENLLFVLSVLKDLEEWVTDADKFCAKQLVQKFNLSICCDCKKRFIYQ